MGHAERCRKKTSQISRGILVASICLLSSPSVANQNILRTSDMIELIGVNTHMAYNDGAYANLDNVVRDMKFLGIHHIRDELPGIDSQPALQSRNALATLTRENVRLDVLFHSGWTPTSVAWLRILETQVLGAVASVEGYNEINNFPPKFEGQTGAAAAKAGQKALYALIKSDPVLKNVPVIDMTGFEMIRNPFFSYGETLSGYADVMNVHVYPQNGGQPSSWINSERPRNYRRLEAELPKVITEFGYSSKPDSKRGFIGIDDRGQAKGVLNGLFDAARSGYEKVYLYELLDEKPDPDMKEREFHFGLFTFASEPKPAAMAIRNLTTILGRSSHGSDRSANVPPDSGSISVDLGQPDQGTPVLSLILAKEDGSKLIALWRETPIWDTTSGRPLEAPPIQAVVGFAKACADIRSYDPLRSSDPISIGKGTSAALSVADHVQLVECTP
jgi:hypothetical protein